jgi:hypothetical protein
MASKALAAKFSFSHKRSHGKFNYRIESYWVTPTNEVKRQRMGGVRLGAAARTMTVTVLSALEERHATMERDENLAMFLRSFDAGSACQFAR